MLVLKTIVTPLRRVSAGEEISPSELDGPLTIEDWQRLGCLDGGAVPSADSEDYHESEVGME